MKKIVAWKVNRKVSSLMSNFMSCCVLPPCRPLPFNGEGEGGHVSPHTLRTGKAAPPMSGRAPSRQVGKSASRPRPTSGRDGMLISGRPVTANPSFCIVDVDRGCGLWIVDFSWE